MQNIHWIILAIVAVNVIGAIVKGLSKTQQKERQEELAAQRRQAAMQQAHQRQQSAGPVRPGSQGAGGQQAGRYPSGRPLDTLAQRRKEQLEQLRQRRQQRGATPPIQARVGSPSSSSASQPAGLASPRLTSLADRMEKTRRAEQRLQERREAAARAQAELARTQLQAQRAQARPTRQAGKARVVVPLVIEPAQRRPAPLSERHLGELRTSIPVEPQSTGEAHAGVAGGTAEFSRSVRRQMRSSASLRQLFVLKELLDPPVSMRRGAFSE